MSSPWEYPLDLQYILRNYRKRIRELRQCQTPAKMLRIAVLGGSTTAQLADLVTAFLLERGLDAKWFESDYNQYNQVALLGNEALAAFDPELIYLHVNYRNLENWPRIEDDGKVSGQKTTTELTRWNNVWQGLHRQYPRATVIQNTFELPRVRLLGNMDGLDPRGGVAFVRSVNQSLAAAAADNPWLILHDLEYVAARFGLDRWCDDHLWYAYKMAVSPDGLVELAHSLAILVGSLYGTTRKAVVTDLDNTLWAGVIGDDGLAGIRLGAETPEGEAHAALQQYLAGLKARGILLAVASKNENAAARSGFSHPDSVLQTDDFAAFWANWRSKPENIRDIAAQLNIGLDSLVFLDDNPAERDIVAAELPMIATPDVGPDVVEYVRHLERNGWFDPVTVSTDDLTRSRFYATNAARASLAHSAASYHDYLLSLDMRAEIAPFTQFYLERITQLVNKTNQFNLTTLRLTQAEVADMIDSPDWLALYARLADKFGDNGLVSVVAGRCRKTTLEIELWLMSCRVLKRELEKAMLDELTHHCRLRGITSIMGWYRPTAKNALVADLYAELGFCPAGEDTDGSTRWRLEVAGYTKQNRVIEVKQ